MSCVYRDFVFRNLFGAFLCYVQQIVVRVRIHRQG